MITRILRSWPSPAAELAVGWVLALLVAAEVAAAVPPQWPESSRPVASYRPEQRPPGTRHAKTAGQRGVVAVHPGLVVHLAESVSLRVRRLRQST